MALSNIAKEPRREIIETLAGFGLVIAIAAVVATIDYLMSIWFNQMEPDIPLWAFASVLWILLIGFTLLGYIALNLIHALGEGVCEVLDDHGIHLRPKREGAENEDAYNDLFE